MRTMQLLPVCAIAKGYNKPGYISWAGTSHFARHLSRVSSAILTWELNM